MLLLNDGANGELGRSQLGLSSIASSFVTPKSLPKPLNAERGTSQSFYAGIPLFISSHILSIPHASRFSCYRILLSSPPTTYTFIGNLEITLHYS